MHRSQRSLYDHVVYCARRPLVDTATSTGQGRRSLRIIGGTQKKTGGLGTEVPQRRPGAEPR